MTVTEHPQHAGWVAFYVDDVFVGRVRNPTTIANWRTALANPDTARQWVARRRAETWIATCKRNLLDYCLRSGIRVTWRISLTSRSIYATLSDGREVRIADHPSTVAHPLSLHPDGPWVIGFDGIQPREG